jgi:hypothetical protein
MSENILGTMIKNAIEGIADAETRLRVWLSDPDNIHWIGKPGPGYTSVFPLSILRKRFVTKNGTEMSIQQGASHYCDYDSVELFYCPPHWILNQYGDAPGPYCKVPISVVAQYIALLERDGK